jgi:hypothetical protein
VPKLQGAAKLVLQNPISGHWFEKAPSKVVAHGEFGDATFCSPCKDPASIDSVAHEMKVMSYYVEVLSCSHQWCACFFKDMIRLDEAPTTILHVVLYALGLDALLAKGQAQMKLSLPLQACCCLNEQH